MISLIVAADENNAIGYQNQLLCQLKDDMKHFVDTTLFHTVIMGSKTFESIGYPLKHRFNIVLTGSPMSMTAQYYEVLEQHKNLMFDSFPYIQFMMERSPEEEFIVIGGSQTYELFLPYASRIYFTRIHHTFEQADTFFPAFDWEEWSVNELGTYPKNERNEYPFHLYLLERK